MARGQVVLADGEQRRAHLDTGLERRVAARSERTRHEWAVEARRRARGQYGWLKAIEKDG